MASERVPSPTTVEPFRALTVDGLRPSHRPATAVSDRVSVPVAGHLVRPRPRAAVAVGVPWFLLPGEGGGLTALRDRRAFALQGCAALVR